MDKIIEPLLIAVFLFLFLLIRGYIGGLKWLEIAKEIPMAIGMLVAYFIIKQLVK